MITRTLNFFFQTVFLLGMSSGAVQAEQWPDAKRPIRLVVPYTPGGTTDLIGRLLAEGLSQELGGSVIVENLSGANGSIGAGMVARAEPDGYTLLLGSPGPMIVNKYVNKNLNYDPKTAFSPVALVGQVPNVLMTRTSLEASNVAELVDLVKRGSATYTFGSPGVGSGGQVSSELFKLQADINATHIPYKGSSPMLVDLVSGTTDFAIDQLSSALAFIKNGKLKALAVTSKARSDQLPDVPTLQESGFPNYEVVAWFCVAAPVNTPEPRIAKLNAAINKFLANPETKAKFANLGAQTLGGTPEDLVQRVATEEKNIQAVSAVVDFGN